MTVRKSERNKSKFEVRYQAILLHDELCDLSYRCFGIYSRNSPLRPKHERLLRIEEDPDRIDHIIFERQNSIEELAENLLNAIESANAIYPRSHSEYDIRLSYQDKALILCKSIKMELNSIARMYDCDVSIFENSINLVNREIKLIQKWRQKDRRRFNNLP